MFAAIVQGHDADLWILIACILFAVQAILDIVGRSLPFSLLPAGLAFLALGFLVT